MARRRRFSGKRSFRGSGGRRRFGRGTRSSGRGAGTLRIVIEQGAATIARPGVPGSIGIAQAPAVRKAKF